LNNCIVCSGIDKFVPIFHNTLLKCSNCGFITANLNISETELKKIYSENYFKGEEYLNYLADKTAIQKNFLKRLLQIKSKFKNHIVSNALEIGCAYGFFAEVFSKIFPGSSYTGIDIVEEAIVYGREKLKQNLYLSDYLSYPMKTQYSDVFMWDVIEHLREPQKVIEKISNELITGGKLYITTGDISSLVPKIQKNKWRMIHPPSHLHYFSAATLKNLLSKNGFIMDSVSNPPVYRSIKQIYYSLFLLNKKSRRGLKNIFDRIPENWQIPINTDDIMFVTARKARN
jgi:2-polyprenyl-3-methyl-5-hydroxy-6-metoxy-1,4-benzoquinol methylase